MHPLVEIIAQKYVDSNEELFETNAAYDTSIPQDVGSIHSDHHKVSYWWKTERNFREGKRAYRDTIAIVELRKCRENRGAKWINLGK